MNDVVQAVSTVGFPIVMCLLMAWYFTKRDATMTAALNELTIAVNKLCSKLDGGEDNGESN